MTENQYRQHAEIMKELRARFQTFWTDKLLPAIELGTHLDERAKAVAMQRAWNAFRKAWVTEKTVWFLDPENKYQNQ